MYQMVHKIFLVRAIGEKTQIKRFKIFQIKVIKCNLRKKIIYLLDAQVAFLRLHLLF